MPDLLGFWRTQAQAAANLFLFESHMGDRFMADTPLLDEEANVWRVPVLLSYAVIGPVGQVGEIVMTTTRECDILSHTPFEEMKANARRLYEENRDRIEGPVP